MKGRGTFILLALALALGAYTWFGEVRGGAERAKRKDEEKKVFALAGDSVSALEVTREGETVALRRTADGWTLESPIHAAADRQAVEDALRTLLDARKDTVVEENPGDLAVYGLGDQALEIALRGGGNAASQEVLVGDFNPTRSFVYAMWPGTPKVWLVSAGLRHAVDKGPGDFRDRSVLSIEMDKVRRFEVTRADGAAAVAVERERPEHWRVTSPVACRADRIMVEQTLRQLESARVERYVDETPADPAAYGLAPARLVARVEMEPPAGTRTLRLGRAADSLSGRYARRDDRSPVMLLADDSLVRFLERTADDYRAKTLVDFDQGEVKKVVIAAEDSVWTIVRSEKEAEGGKKDDPDTPLASIWTRQGANTRVRSEWMSDFLWDVRRLRHTAVLPPPGALAACGLDQPAFVVRLFGENGAAVGEVRLGAERAGTEERYAMNAAEPDLYTVARSAVASFPLLPDSLTAALEGASSSNP